MVKRFQKPVAERIGEGYDVRTGLRSWVFKVTDKKGKVTYLVFPFGSHNSTESGILEAIGRAGYPVPLDASERHAFFRSMTEDAPRTEYEIASASGWIADSSFVTPRRVYGTGVHRVVSVVGQSTFGQRFRPAGTLAEWQCEVAKPLLGNKLGIFGVAVAFASPLQQLLGVESGGFHLVGPSSIGKSTILVAAGSVWGGGLAGFPNTWLSTRNALDDTASVHSDCFLALDETALAGDTTSEAAKTVLHATHRLSSGEEKARKNDKQQRQTWRIQFLGSTEHTLQQLGLFAKEAVAAGQYVRLVDIEADAGCGWGVWEKLPKSVSTPAQFSDALRASALRLHGTPSHRYLQRLVAAAKKDRKGLTASLQKRMNAFLARISHSGY